MKITITQHAKERLTNRPRIYIFPRDESIAEQFFNRKERPYKIWRKEVLPQVWEQLGIDSAKVRWSQYAGCSCPCSPGFIITEGYSGSDVFVNVSAN